LGEKELDLAAMTTIIEGKYRSLRRSAERSRL
jgi:hypothetical protein